MPQRPLYPLLGHRHLSLRENQVSPRVQSHFLCSHSPGDWEMSTSTHNTTHGRNGVYGRVIVHADLDCFYCQVSDNSCLELAPCLKVFFCVCCFLLLQTLGEILQVARAMRAASASVHPSFERRNFEVAAGCLACSTADDRYHVITGQPQVA